MDIVLRLQREFAYNNWANRQTLQSLTAARQAPPRAVEVMAHIVGAEWLWLRRLGRPAPELAVWPTLLPSDCVIPLQELAAAWASLLAEATVPSLDREVVYTNSKGEPWTNTVADVLTHVLLHSSYHRGQIATLLGQAGEAAAYSDYIECVRRGHVDDSGRH